MSYADRLSSLDDDFARAQTNGRGLPPDGTYQAIVDRFDFIDAADLLLKTELRITGGDHDGMNVECLHNLTQPDRLDFVKKHLAALEIMPEKLSELEVVLPHALDNIVEITVKTSAKTDAEGNNYRNMYVNKTIHRAGATDVPVPAMGNGPVNEDIPF
jgi:hypothetical protein